MRLMQPSFSFDSGLTPFTRFEMVDPDDRVDNDQGQSIIVGLNHKLAQGLIVKIEYNHLRGGSASSLASFPSDGYDELKSAVVLGF